MQRISISHMRKIVAVYETKRTFSGSQSRCFTGVSGVVSPGSDSLRTKLAGQLLNYIFKLYLVVGVLRWLGLSLEFLEWTK